MALPCLPWTRILRGSRASSIFHSMCFEHVSQRKICPAHEAWHTQHESEAQTACDPACVSRLRTTDREVDRDVRTIALDDQGGAGADGEARRPIGEQGGRQARRHKASAVNFPSMTRRYRATTFSIAVAGALAIAACSTDDGGGATVCTEVTLYRF